MATRFLQKLKTDSLTQLDITHHVSEPQRLDLIAPTNDRTVRNNPRDPFLSRNKRWRETHVSLTMQLLPQRSDGPQHLSLSQLCLSVSLSLSLSKLCKIQKKKTPPTLPELFHFSRPVPTISLYLQFYPLPFLQIPSISLPLIP